MSMKRRVSGKKCMHIRAYEVFEGNGYDSTIKSTIDRDPSRVGCKVCGGDITVSATIVPISSDKYSLVPIAIKDIFIGPGPAVVARERVVHVRSSGFNELVESVENLG